MAIVEEWSHFFEEMVELNNISFPRCLTPQDTDGLPMLYIFSDASQDAFGACVYL